MKEKEFVFHISGILTVRASNSNKAWDLFLKCLEERGIWFDGISERLTIRKKKLEGDE